MAEPLMKLIPLDDLHPNPRNPKRHSDATIGASINRFGWIDPVVVDQRTDYLVAGHGRVESLTAMRDAGEDPPAGIVVDRKTKQWKVPTVVSWASANDVEAEAAIVALNRTSEMGGWDPAGLYDILAQLSEGDALVGVGYGSTDIDILRRTVEADEKFTMDFSDVIDEFLDETGTGDEANRRTSFKVIRVYFPDEDGVRTFFDKLGLAYDDKVTSLGYPHMPERRVAGVFDA